jgi:hypothetical protein
MHFYFSTLLSVATILLIILLLFLLILLLVLLLEIIILYLDQGHRQYPRVSGHRTCAARGVESRDPTVTVK